MKSFYKIAVKCLLLLLFVLNNKASAQMDTLLQIVTDSQWTKANTALDVDYLSLEEKKVIALINLARMYPSWFNTNIVKNYDLPPQYQSIKTSSYYISLQQYLDTLSELSSLSPSQILFKSASCHAKAIGLAGLETHDRTNKNCKKLEAFFGEAISFGFKNALDIVMQLLIDDGVKDLGHRKILLGQYDEIAIAIAPHKKWQYVAVIDCR